MSGDAKKNDQGKLRYDLIPPECLRELARVYTIGSHKYADNNWKNGLDRHRIEAALLRHSEAARSGEVLDPEDGQRHLASVAWCAFALMWYDIQSERDDEQDRERQIAEAGGEGYARVSAIFSKNDAVADALDKRASNFFRGRVTD